MNPKPLLMTLAMAFVCVPAFAQWQWLDKDGRKVFSDRSPPPDVLDKNILKRPASAARPAPDTVPPAAGDNPVAAAAPLVPASTPKATALDKEIEAKKKQAADAEAAKANAEQERITKAKIENCARAKQAKASFDSGVRLSRTNAAGEREVMDDAARAAEVKRIQGVVDSDCK